MEREKRTKLLLIAIGLSLLFLGFTGCKDNGRIVEPKEGPAHLVIPKQVWELGKVYAGDGIIQSDVLMINDGNEPLEIKGVESSCPCIRAEYSGKPIKPGHGARLKVFLNTNVISPGDFGRSVIVLSNGGTVEINFMGKRMN